METTILKLSQEEAEHVYNNGDYVCKITKPIQINEGDAINIKNVFIDTVSSSTGKIILTKDTEFYFEFFLYQNTTFLFSENTSRYPCARFWKDNDRFSDSMNSGTPALFAGYHSYYGTADSVSFSGTCTMAGTLTGTYYNRNGELQTFSVVLKPADIGKTGINKPIGKADVAEHTMRFQFSNKIIERYGFTSCTFNYSTSGAMATSYVIPYSLAERIIIEAGQYDPDDIALEISQQLSVLNSKNSDDITYINGNVVENNLLNRFGMTGFVPPNGNTQILFVLQDKSDYFDYVQNAGFLRYDGFLFGTDAFDLKFNAETSKFYFNKLHRSLYKVTSGDETVYIYNQQDKTGANTGKTVVLSSLGGCEMKDF